MPLTLTNDLAALEIIRKAMAGCDCPACVRTPAAPASPADANPHSDLPHAAENGGVPPLNAEAKCEAALAAYRQARSFARSAERAAQEAAELSRRLNAEYAAARTAFGAAVFEGAGPDEHERYVSTPRGLHRVNRSGPGAYSVSDLAVSVTIPATA